MSEDKLKTEVIILTLKISILNQGNLSFQMLLDYNQNR